MSYKRIERGKKILLLVAIFSYFCVFFIEILYAQTTTSTKIAAEVIATTNSGDKDA
ncbi:MAG: hypothetical protein J6U44_04425 [Paludibacteraceae bacterium]|nr:hypothetical protein [Paludibacteraceae bacterium]MBO7316391.1 hypothetical protein [Paludibacteraceae bacterium]